MSNLSEQGKITQVLTPQAGTSKAGKEWNKQDFVIETLDQYPKSICFTLFGDKTSLLNNLKQGDNVEVFFNLESREFNEKWYHNVNAWKVETLVSEPVNETQQSVPDAFKNEPEDNSQQEEDDLPF